MGKRLMVPPRVLALALLGWLFYMPAVEAAAQGTAGERLEYRLGSGDRVRVTVFNEPTLSGEFAVDGSGVVSLPLVGEVPVGGMTLRQAERTMEARFLEGYLRQPRVSIDVLNYRPFYILGEVKAPGSYPFVNGMTVLNAVALAGGFTYRARESRITIIRGNDTSRVPEDATAETTVLPGDIIKVPERFF